MKNELITQSKKSILNYIADLKLQTGDTLPSIRQLQSVLLLSKNSAMAALKELCSDGILVKGDGARNGFIIHELPESETPAHKEKKLTAKFILPYNTWNYVGNQFLFHIEKEFSSRSGNLLLSNTENSPVIEHRLLQTLLAADTPRPDILLLMASNSIQNMNLNLLHIIQNEIPIILIDRTVRDLDCSSVCLNNRMVGMDAARKLWDRGHRVFAFVGGFSSISPIQDRLTGYLSMLREKECTPDHTHVILDPDMDMGSYPRIRTQINELGEKILRLTPAPTAVVCGSDRLATCLLNFFLSKGIYVPEELAIIGCDGDTVFSEFTDKKLCSYRQPFAAMSQFIYQTAADLAEHPDRPFFHAEFPPEYIEGNTI